MVTFPSESEGGREEDKGEIEEEEEEEEEEDEPRLKYQRVGGSIPLLLASDAASCICVAERMIAVGTLCGTVHILDFLGNQVKLTSILFVFLVFGNLSCRGSNCTLF